jgi:hypothetical protein
MARLLTPGQAAEILGVTTARLQQFRYDGRLKAVAFGADGGAPFFYDATEIEKFSKLERPSHRPKSKPGKQIKKLRKSDQRTR